MGYVKDGRIVAAPLHWFDWLEQATAEQRANYHLGSFSIVWPEFEDGIDMEALLICRRFKVIAKR